jgi:opacity protein-like surface antigen
MTDRGYPHMSNPMKFIYLLIFLTLFSVLGSPLQAQSHFDGFRMGLDGTYSETSLRIDATQTRDTALGNAHARISSGELALANAAEQLNGRRAAFEVGGRALVEGQQRLLETEQLAAVSPPDVAADLAPTIAQLRRETELGVASFRTQAVALDEADWALETGRAQLAEGSRLAAELNGFPGISGVTLSGLNVRFSLGWGMSFATSLGRIHVGGEIDGAPGTGDAVIRVPARFDTHVEGGDIFGATVRLGWIPVSWAMPYVTTGAETQQLHITRNRTSRSQQATGFRVGGGIEFSISEHNIVRVGYDRTIIPDISFAGAKVTPSRDTYRIGFVRRF